MAGEVIRKVGYVKPAFESMMDQQIQTKYSLLAQEERTFFSVRVE